MPPPAPGFLRNRIQAAKAKAAQLHQPPNPAPPVVAGNQPATAKTRKTRKAEIQPKPTEKGAGNPSDAKIPTGGLGIEGIDFEALADRVVANAANPAEAALLRPVLPAVLRAQVEGASRSGAGGTADRAALWKLLALPFAASEGAKKVATNGSLTDRLVAAQARKERRLGAETATPQGGKAH